jgi:hypothetical protein
LEENIPIGTHRILIIEVTLEYQIILLRSFQEIQEIYIGMIKKFKPLSKKILLLMKKERMKKLILKFIALVTTLHPLT